MRVFVVAMVCLALFQVPVFAQSTSRELRVLPPEHKVMTDPVTGAELRFLTTGPGQDINLYFHQRAWMLDGSMILFNSDRGEGRLMGYLVATGELVVIAGIDTGVDKCEAGVARNVVLGFDGDKVVETAFDIEVSPDPATTPSKVTAHERVLGMLPPQTGALQFSESCDGKLIGIGSTHWTHMDGAGIITLNQETGEVKDICKLDPDYGYGGHLQFSHSNPHVFSIAARTPLRRFWLVDIRDGVPRSPYLQWEGELVTHESWWVDDQLLFCGGTHPMPTEDAHVKVLDTRTGAIRIIGAGAWWPGADAKALAKENWWHPDGSDDGRWVVADNWHGDIMLFEGKTTRPRLLTAGHRTYGQGDHPHVGFDRKGEQVVFTSHLLGSPDVCVATIPKEWQEKNPS